MVERLLILRNDTFDDDTDNTTARLSKTQSFNTDDDEHNSEPPSKSNSEAKLDVTSINEALLKPAAMLIHSASVDTLNDQDSLTGDVTSEKVKKKRRRPTEASPSFDISRRAPKKRAWYKKIDFTKPLMYVAIVILIYLMWAKRDVWIPRLLTSNSRVRYTASINEQKLHERAESHASAKDSSNSQQDDDDDDDDDNDQTSNNNDDDGPATSNRPSSAQKLTIRTRRNKMSFGKDTQPKKRRYLKHNIVDDDVDIDDDDDDDTIIDDVDDTSDGDIVKESALPASIHSSKRHRHQRSSTTRSEKLKHPTRNEKSKRSTRSKTSLISTRNEDIIEQLRQLIKSKGQHKDLLTTLAKETGLEKSKINRFIQKKDYSIITLDTFISLLNSFDSKILVVSN